MKPRNSNNCPNDLSVFENKTKALSTRIVIILLLAVFARCESLTAAVAELPVRHEQNTVNPLSKAASTHNQAALAQVLDKNKPADADLEAWNNNLNLISQNSFNPATQPVPRFALTEGQLQLLKELYSPKTDAARRKALNQLSGSSRANSLMIGMNSYWAPAFDRLQLRGPQSSSNHGNRGGAWRPTQSYQPLTMYEMYGSGPGEYIVSESMFPGSMYHDMYPVYPMYEGSPAEQKRFIEFSDFLDSGNTGVFHSHGVFYDGEPVEVDGAILYEYFGQCPRRSPQLEPIQFWFNPYYSGLNVGGDWNADAYNISRTGVMLGGHMNVGRNSAMGVVFGYSDPVLSQNYARYTANDYHFGIYGGTYINEIYELKGYLGVGFQEYTTRRTADFGSVAGRTAGHNFAMSVEFARPLDDACGGFWKPYLALDLNRVHQDGYREYLENGYDFSFRYDDASLMKTFFRLGVNREINRKHWKVRAGLAFSTLMGGESTPESVARWGGTSERFTEYGVDTAKDFIHGNVGLEYFLNCRRTTSLFSDYNVQASQRATDYFVSLGFRWMM